MLSAVCCKCTKSKCVKESCECYQQGITCNDDCACIDCKNTKADAADGRSPKKGSSVRKAAVNTAAAAAESEMMEVDDDSSGVRAEKTKKSPPRHTNKKTTINYPSSRKPAALDSSKLKKGDGCSCKNSKCEKEYCVCYKAGVECSVGRCKCVGCKNPNGAISKYSSNAAVNRSKASKSQVSTADDTKCSCTKTTCLKLYCECFRQDLVCNSNCECLDCKNTEEESGPNGDRTRAKNEIMKTRPMVFKTPKKVSGVGCSCTRNKCIAKYCDCNARGKGCDPAICTCVNCGNMMKPFSEMTEDDVLQEVREDKTGVFIPEKVDDNCKVKGLHNFSHLIDDFEGDCVSNPSNGLNGAYLTKKPAAQAAKKVKEEETEVRRGLENEIKEIEAQLEEKIRKEQLELSVYRAKTNTVMCLEMEEPCRWNETYQQLKEYVIKTGDLPPVPSGCTTETDRRLSIWIQEQKSLVYSKSERIVNAPHRIEALEALGIELIETSEEEKWNKMYGRLAAYKRQHGTVMLPSFMQCRKSKDKEMAALRHWIDSQEKEVKSWSTEDIGKRRDRLKKLQDLGLPLKLSWEQEWDFYIIELLKFRSKYGHLSLADSNKPELKAFLSEVLTRLKRGGAVKLTHKEKCDLREKGLLTDLKNMIKNPVGRPAKSRPMQLLPLDRVKEVNYWAGMLEQLKAYQAEHDTLEFDTNRYGGAKWAHLRDWVEAQRKSYENKTLEESRIKELQRIGLEFDQWDKMFKKLRKFKREGGTARLPKEFKTIDGEEDDEVTDLCKWVQHQIRLYRGDKLDAEKKKKLRKLGVVLTKNPLGKTPWETRFDEMIDFYRANKTCLPKREGPLRQWVLELVDLIQNGFVSAKRQKMIDDASIGPFLRPEVVFSEASSGKKKRKAESFDMTGDDKKLKASTVTEV